MQSMSQTRGSPSHRAYIDQPMTNDYQDVENYRHQQQQQQQQQSLMHSIIQPSSPIQQRSR